MLSSSLSLSVLIVDSILLDNKEREAVPVALEATDAVVGS